MVPLFDGRRGWGPISLCVSVLCWCAVLLRGSKAQGQPLMDPGSVPPGLRAWLGRDFCGTAPWVADFHSELAGAIGRAQGSDVAGALADLGRLIGRQTANPYAAYECATAIGSAFLVAAQCAEALQLMVLSARLRQLSAIFTSYDYQMKGEEYLDQSPWPVKWTEAMEGILRAMANLKSQERATEVWRGLPARTAVAHRGGNDAASVSGGGLRVAIVSVCDYDAGQTPLARLSQINKQEYARVHGYDVMIYEKAPIFKDRLSELFTEPAAHRPPAWSKVDAILTTLAQTRHDWVMWMDCDSFFMDFDVALDAFVSKAMADSGCPAAGTEVDDLIELRRLVNRWMDGPEDHLGQEESLMQWYDNMFAEHWSNLNYACGELDVGALPIENQTLGWTDWLLKEKRPHLIASEDGLMLNTGNVLVRASSWSWQFFQKVRAMTFGISPVTQHPWWEQTAMVYLLQLPFTLAHVSRQGAVEDLGPFARSRGYAPACFMFSQKQLNGYPPLVAAALLTHEEFASGDFIVSFSGCKIYSSQEVCNHLFMNYFFQVHDVRLLETDVALKLWM